MFTAGELVVYGGEGVCRVEKIGPSTIPGADKTKLYYTLLPLYRTGQVLTPVDTRVLMRPVLSREEACLLVEQLAQRELPQGPGNNPRAQKEYYQAAVTSYDCGRLADLIRLLSHKRAHALHQGKKPGQMDERYLKRAEDQLYGELGAVLELDRAAVADYIRCCHPTWPEI